MQTEELSRLHLSPVWEKPMNVKFIFQSSPSLFWVLTKRPGRESSARENSHHNAQLSICWLSPGPGTLNILGISNLWPHQELNAERLPKPPGDQVFSGAARGFLQFLRHGQEEQSLGPWSTPGHQLQQWHIIQGHFNCL